MSNHDHHCPYCGEHGKSAAHVLSCDDNPFSQLFE
jgi:hypothetical protein